MMKIMMEEMITWKKIIKKVTGGGTGRYTLVQEELWSFQTQPYFQISFTKNVLKKQKIIEKSPFGKIRIELIF